MRKLKVLYFALIALVAGVLFSCTNDYEPGEQATGAQVMFLPSNPTLIEFDGTEGEEVQRLTLSRVNTKKLEDVYIMVEADEEYKKLFKINDYNIVTFYPGEAKADLVITVDKEKFQDNKVYSVKFSIADKYQVTPYGYSEWTVDFGLNPWLPFKNAENKVITGKFRGLSVLDYLLGISVPAEIETKIYYHKENQPGVKELYKVESPWVSSLVNLFEGATTEDVINSFETTLPLPGLVIDCTDHNNVKIAEQKWGLKDIYGVWYDPEMPFGDGVLAAEGGSLEDGVITFPKGGIAFAFEVFLSDSTPLTSYIGEYGGNQSGLFRVILPGYEVADYTLAGTYKGMEVAADNKTVYAKLELTYGDDVKGIKYLVVEGDIENHPEEYVSKLLDGTDENIQTIEDFEAGAGSVNIKLQLQRGVYSLIAAPVKKDDTLYAKSTTIVPFYFPGIGEQEDTSCQINVKFGLVSEFTDDPSLTPDDLEELKNYPDYTSLGYSFSGKHLKSISYYLQTTELVDKLLAESTPEEVVATHGVAFPVEVVDVASNETWIGTFGGFDPATEYKLILVVKNIYGESVTITETATTTVAPPYEGTLVLGDYQMSCTNSTTDGSTTESKNIFNVQNIPGHNDKFYVTNFAIEDNNQWYAEYNAEDNTLVLSGLIRYLEDKGDNGNMFGYGLGYYNESGTQLYYVSAFPDEDHKQDDKGNMLDTGPVTFKVDPTTNQLCGLADKLYILVGVNDNTNSANSFAHKIFSASRTTVAPYVPETEGEGTTNEENSETPEVNDPTAQSIVKHKTSVSIPFSSIRIAKDLLPSKTNSFVSSEGFKVSHKSASRSIKPISVEWSAVKHSGYRIGEASFDIKKF